MPKKLLNDAEKYLGPEQSPPWAPAKFNNFNTSTIIKPGSKEKRKYKNEDLDFGDNGGSGGRMKKGKV